MILIDTVVEKFKEILTESDFESLKSQISDLIVEEAKKKSDLIVEEKIKIYKEATEKYIEEAKEEIKSELIKDYDLKMEQLEEKLIITLDKLIDLEISKNISEDLIKSFAVNEALMPVVEGIKKVFSDNSVDLDCESFGLVKKLKIQNEQLTKELSESIAQKMEVIEEKTELLGKLEKISVSSLITEKTEGLKVEQKERIVKMFEDKKFSEVDEQIDSMIELVIKEENNSSSVVKDKIVENDGISGSKSTLDESLSAAKLAKMFF